MAARIAFDNVDALEIRDTVERLTDDGVYSDHFIEIMDSNPPTLRDVLPPFRAYLAHVGLSIPSKDTAVRQIIHHHLAAIVAGTIAPFEGLKRLIADVYWDYDFHSPTTRYLGDSHGIEHLIGLYWGHDDMIDRPTEVSCNGKYGEEGFQELEKEILKHSKEWMNSRFANHTSDGIAANRTEPSR